MDVRPLAGLLLASVLCTPLSAQCERAALRGRNTMYKDFFGKSCSMDGSSLVVGAFASTTTRPGSAHVFQLVNGVWTQTARLLPSDGNGGDEFGNSVGISGSRVIVGAEYNDNSWGSNAGAAYVFERVGTKWVQFQKLHPHDARQSHHFGEYVAIEGDVAVVGCRFDSELGNNAGAAYVFERIDGKWTETAKLLGSEGRRNDLSADTLAIDGGRILVGSYRSDASGGHSGSAYLFEKVDGAWKETAHLVALDGAGELSRGVAIDGDRIVLGARLESTLGDAAGAGYVFEKWNGEWSQTAKLLPRSGQALDWIGEAVAVQGDRVVLSGHHHDGVAPNSGVAYVFELRDGQWVETHVLQSTAASTNDEFSFALSFSGSNLVATAPFDGGNLGSAYVFSCEDCGCDGTGGGWAARFGENLGNANTGTLDALSPPNPGSVVEFRVDGIPSGTTGTIYLGTQKVQRTGSGGTQLVVPANAWIKLPFKLIEGKATVAWPVPETLCDLTLYAQAVAIDASQPLGRTLTNGVELHLGR